jgi:hypothetical protein
MVHTIRLLLATVAVLALATPGAAHAADPVQCCAGDPPPDTQRLAVYDTIRGSLPNIGQPWSVYCTRNHPVRMTCWARNPGAKFTRRYLASVRPGGHSIAAVPPWRLGNAKSGRFDGRRG